MSTESDVSSVSWADQSSESSSYSNSNSAAKDEQIKEKSSMFGKRKKLVIFGIIAILILIIIAIMAIMIAFLKPNNATNGTNTPPSNHDQDPTEATFAITTIIYEVGNGGITGDPPCSSHIVINDPSRNVGMSGIGGVCDNGPLFNSSIGGRWIRFLGTGGTKMPSSSPGMKHCSAFLAGWSNVTLPSTTGIIVNGTGCFETPLDICTFHIPIAVVNCATFYVYFLSPLSMCNARYCTI